MINQSHQRLLLFFPTGAAAAAIDVVVRTVLFHLLLRILQLQVTLLNHHLLLQNQKDDCLYMKFQNLSLFVCSFLSKLREEGRVTSISKSHRISLEIENVLTRTNSFGVWKLVIRKCASIIVTTFIGSVPIKMNIIIKILF